MTQFAEGRFVGRSSCGFKRGQTYELQISTAGGEVWVYDLHSWASRKYSSVKDVLKSWEIPGFSPVWVSAKERLPEDGKEVLCWYEYYRYGDYNRMFRTYGIGYYCCGRWGGEVTNGSRTKVLAWRYLPPPPAGMENAAK